MSEFVPMLAPQGESSGMSTESLAPSAPHTFTEEEVGEYREQDRYLPVRIARSSLTMALN